MANQIYANNMEVSCKAAAGKSICAFPDVCFTPPQTPATPPGVPIPYPNTGMASDTTDGSSTVKISGQEVMLKNKSYFKKSMGDEAGCAPKKGLITSKNMGKVYFTMWSMDVKVEGENVVRMMDMTTHNHASWVGNTPPQVYLDRMSMADGVAACDGARKEVASKCKRFDEPPCPDPTPVRNAEKARDKIGKKLSKAQKKTNKAYLEASKEVNTAYDDFAAKFRENTAEAKCLKALACFLSPQDPSRCCDKQTPHHLIPSSSIVGEGKRGSNEPVLKPFSAYTSKGAPCICAEGSSWHQGSHKRGHNGWADKVGPLDSKKTDLVYTNNSKAKDAEVITYGQALEGAKASAKKVAPHCSPACIEGQLNKFHLGKEEATKADKAKPIRRTMDDDAYKTTAPSVHI
jgi:hypothetical protein